MEHNSLSRSSSPSRDSGGKPRFSNLRGVRWRINLGILPSSPLASIDDLRRVAADARRSYASLRRRLLIDPHISKDGNKSPDLSVDNPLSQNPESTWSRYFRNAELEKAVEQDLSRIYPEEEFYFQTNACQAMLKRILLVWCLRHPKCGYRQGIHELIAPLVYVLHADLDHLSQVRELYEDYFTDEFDRSSCEIASNCTLKKDKNWDLCTSADDFKQINMSKVTRLDDLDLETRDVLLLSDSYGAEGELGIVLSEKFMEHDAYCMFDGLMSGAHGVVSMAEFFYSCPSVGSSTGFPPVIEASSALYHLLSIVDSSLHDHLIELGVEPQYFSIRWLRLLFGREFSLCDLLAIWDELFSSHNGSCMENNEYRFMILCSPRGALISSMAVSMLLHMRSSLLATENATFCLKRLLNFPRDVNVKKLLEKARCCHVLALEVNMAASSQAGLTKSISSVVSRTGLMLPKSIQIMPESYWEDKWRLLHEEKMPQVSDSNGGLMKGLLGETLGSLMAESYSSTKTVNMEEEVLSFADHGDTPIIAFSPPTSLSHSLFDLVPENGVQHIFTGRESPPMNEDTRKSFSEELECENGKELIGEDCLSTGNSSVFSMNNGVNSLVNELEIESEKCSITSSLFVREVANGNNHLEAECINPSDIPILKESEANTNVTKPELKMDVEIKGVSEKKMRKLAAGKFQWFWRIGKGNFSEKSSAKGIAAESQRPTIIGKDSACQEQLKSSASDCRNCGDCERVTVGDMKMKGTLKNYGQSMLENVQVIESMFQLEKVQAANILGCDEQAAAMEALKKLRKISIILSEM